MRRDRGDLPAALAGRLQEALARVRATLDESELLTAASRLARDPATMARRCAWCGRLELGRSWRAPESAPEFLVATLERRATHTICPDCLGRLEATGQSRSPNGGSVDGEEAGDAEAEHGQREP